MKLVTEERVDGRGRPAVAHLCKVSPCEHGNKLHVTHVPRDSEFWMPECVDNRGKPRYHKATQEKYPILEALT